ncbi:unnamed protein product [Paramecium sonneborni]|uniref:Uncharacterized protein n=1 Tax=Paramecium sonneborni TaxID=65129 RepID=A0A8S1L5S9_9CILI|nr:unnamed protein product [Paramecium sonneborni]
MVLAYSIQILDPISNSINSSHHLEIIALKIVKHKLKAKL